MKKRIFSLAMLFLLVFTMSVQAAEPRAVSGTPSLSFSGTTAVCSVSIKGNNSKDELDAVLSLYQGETFVDSWSGSGTGRVNVSGRHAAKSGKSYKLVLTYSVNGRAQSSVTVTDTCP